MGELEYRLLTEEEIEAGLASLSGWSVRDGMLSKMFEFSAYLDGAEFARSVAHAAEALDHHPDIRIGWRKVDIQMNTHAVNGLSPYDFELARRIDRLS